MIDIEKATIEHLKSWFGNDVYAEVPEKKPKRFLVCEKTGSGGDEYLCESTMIVQSYAGTKAEASDLNAEVIRNMLCMDEGNLGVTSVDKNSDYPFPDPTTKQYRYQAVFVIEHY